MSLKPHYTPDRTEKDMDPYEMPDFQPFPSGVVGQKAPRSLQELLLLRKGGARTTPSPPITHLTPNEPPLSNHTQQFVAIPEEEEMPSQSVTIPDEVSLVDILNNPMYSPAKGRKTPSPVKSQEDIIELYSTITMLRQENASLQKEMQSIKNSHTAHLGEMRSSYEEKLGYLQDELGNSQQFVATLQQENQEILKLLQEQSVHKSANSTENSLLKSDYSTLKADFSSLKIEYNKLKMENTVQANTNGKLSAEVAGMKGELGSLNRELEDQINRSSIEVGSIYIQLPYACSMLIRIALFCLQVSIMYICICYMLYAFSNPLYNNSYSCGTVCPHI
ncbi:hypothetical protein EON65_38550 [archaeon]|nr:MAG: hypothetical protein EON65_38550 [archaeon]